MSLVVLSLVLIIVMLLAVYAMTRQNALEAEIQTLVKRNNIEQLYDEYQANHRTLNLYVLGGILLTGGFALTFFGGGGIDPRHWQFEQYAYAIIGLVATVSITLGQRALYRSIKQNIAALLVTLLVLAFVIFSEVATTSEREASLVRDRSLDSPALQALLKNIESPDSETIPRNTSAYYAKQVELAKQRLNQCKTQHCRTEQQADVQSYQVAMQQAQLNYQQAIEARRQDKLIYTQTAQSMEYNESNHTAVIKWLKEHADVAFSAAMMFASLIFVVAFESGFHFTGTKEGIYLEAMARLGYTVKRRSRLPTRLRLTAPKQATQPDTRQLQHSTSPNQHSQTSRDTTQSTALHDQTKPSNTYTNTHTPTQNNSEDYITDMKLMHEVAREAKAGEVVTCPSCAQSFKKRAWNQVFCKPACKDHYHNVLNPERLKAVRGAGEGVL